MVYVLNRADTVLALDIEKIKRRELVSKMQQIRIRRQPRQPEPWWSWIDTRTPSGRVLPY